MLMKRYHDHKNTAAKRGIAFKLTFDQWVGIWKSSGKLAKRGRGPGKYVMARFKDKGAYEIGNVKIITFEQNNAERVMPRGSKNGNAILTESKVKRIRKEFIPRSSTHGLNGLAIKYQTSINNVKLIVDRKTWKHVGD